MDFLKDLADINPALIILAVVGLYGLIYFLRFNAPYVLMLIWAVIAISLLLLPGGKQTMTQARHQPAPIDKAHCIASSVITANPWRGVENADKVPACKYIGRGVGGGFAAGSSARDAIGVSGGALVKLYGGQLKN